MRSRRKRRRADSILCILEQKRSLGKRNAVYLLGGALVTFTVARVK